MTKKERKGRRKFWQMKIENFFGKRSKCENFPRSPKKFSEIGGKTETEGNASLPQGMDAPDRSNQPPFHKPLTAVTQQPPPYPLTFFVAPPLSHFAKADSSLHICTSHRPRPNPRE